MEAVCLVAQSSLRSSMRCTTHATLTNHTREMRCYEITYGGLDRFRQAFGEWRFSFTRGWMVWNKSLHIEKGCNSISFSYYVHVVRAPHVRMRTESHEAHNIYSFGRRWPCKRKTCLRRTSSKVFRKSNLSSDRWFETS